MSIDTYDISICTDCLIWHANGDDTGFCDCEIECTSDQHHAIRVAAQLDRQPFMRGSAVVPTGDESYFASTRCDGCGTTLGGDRHDAAVLVQS